MNQRGWMGYLFLLGIAGAAWFAAGIGPIYANDYAMQNAMRGALNDYVAFIVSDEQMESNFTRRAGEQKVDIGHITVTYELDNMERRDWAQATVSYDRTWSLPFTKKVYKRHFQWVKREVR